MVKNQDISKSIITLAANMVNENLTSVKITRTGALVIGLNLDGLEEGAFELWLTNKKSSWREIHCQKIARVAR